MNIIYCTSYLQAPISITIAEKSAGDFEIFFQQKRLYDFFSKLYNKKHLYMFPAPKFYSIKKHKFKLIKYFFQTLSDKRKLKKKLKSYSNHNIYYFGYAYSEFETWTVKYLSKKNNVFYTQSVTIFKDLKILNTLYSWIVRLPYILLYGIKFDVLNNGLTTFTKITDDFGTKIGAKPVDIQSDENLAGGLVAKKFNFSGTDILYLTGAVIEEGFIEKNEFISKNDKLLEFLERKYGKDKISIKIHPRFSNFYSRENDFNKIEKTIPANVILTNFKVVIAYDSTVLFEAANKDILSVSLLNYYVPRSEKTKSSFIKYVHDNLKAGKKVHFPENIEQLNLILDTAINNT